MPDLHTYTHIHIQFTRIYTVHTYIHTKSSTRVRQVDSPGHAGAAPRHQRRSARDPLGHPRSLTQPIIRILTRFKAFYLVLLAYTYTHTHIHTDIHTNIH